MTAVLFGPESLCRDRRVKHIKAESDNTATVAYINAMGGIKSTVCNEMALQLWQWSWGRNIWLSACHFPGTSNKVADGGSRNFDGSRVFEDVSSKRVLFQNDLFACRSNHKVPGYVSWKPDPGAKSECFPYDWASLYLYCFLPFSVIALCLQKIEFN